MKLYQAKKTGGTSKCDYCLEWEYFEGYQSGEGCFCMQRTVKLPENEDCEFYNDVRKGGAI